MRAVTAKLKTFVSFVSFVSFVVFTYHEGHEEHEGFNKSLPGILQQTLQET